jgi:hypothetical protein
MHLRNHSLPLPLSVDSVADYFEESRLNGAGAGGRAAREFAGMLKEET